MNGEQVEVTEFGERMEAVLGLQAGRSRAAQQGRALHFDDDA